MDVEEMNVILFTNLQLLGLDLIDLEDKYKIPFHKDMFNLPNKAGSQVVLHALFTRLNPVTSKEQFRDCWPVIDKKTELQFRKVCNSWLTVIQKDEVDARIPRMNPALLLSPGGRKFIRLLYSFSAFVMMQVMKEEHGWKAQEALIIPSLQANTSDTGNVAILAIRDSCIRERNQFLGRLHLNVAANRKWKEASGELLKDYHGLVKSNKDLEHEKRQQVNVATETAFKLGCSMPAKRAITMFDSDQDSLSVERKKMMEKTRSEWKQLTSFNEKMKEMRNVVQAILDNTASAHTVDGTALGVHVPGLLLRECNKEIHKREIGSAYLSGSLNLVCVLQLWNMCLTLYKQQLETGDLPKTTQEIPALREQSHKHHSHLMSTQEMREEMRNNTLPKLAHHIKCLQKKLNTNNQVTGSNRNNSAELGLGLTARTPHASLLSTNVKSGDTPTTRVVPTSQSSGTPDAVFAVTDNIERTVQKKSSSDSLHSTSSLELGTFLRSSTINKENREKPHPSKEMKKLPQSKNKTSSKPVGHRKPAVLDQGKMEKRKTEPAAISYSPVAKNKGEKPASGNADISSTPKRSGNKQLDFLADAIVNSVLDEDDTKEMCSSPDSDWYKLAQSYGSQDQMANSFSLNGAQNMRTTSPEKILSPFQSNGGHRQLQQRKRRDDELSTNSSKQDSQDQNVSNNVINTFSPVTDFLTASREFVYQSPQPLNTSNFEHLGDQDVLVSLNTSSKKNKPINAEKKFTDDQLLNDIFLSNNNQNANLLDLDSHEDVISDTANDHLLTTAAQNSENRQMSHAKSSPYFHKSYLEKGNNSNMDYYASPSKKETAQSSSLTDQVSSPKSNEQNITRDVEGCVKEYSSNTSHSTMLSPYFDTHLDESLGLGNEVCFLVDSDRDETCSDDGLNESYVPYSGGIVLESKSPARHDINATPTRHGLLSRNTPVYGESATKPNQPSLPSASLPSASQDSIQAKLHALQQKVLNILEDSFELEENGASFSPSPSRNAEAAGSFRNKPDISGSEDLLSL